MTATINSLSDNILCKILSNISFNLEEMRDDYSKTCLVSKKWFKCTLIVQAEKINYRDCKFEDFTFDTYEQMEKFISLAGQKLRILTLNHVKDLDSEKVLDLIDKSTNLHHISINHDVTEEIVNKIATHSKLESLTINPKSNFACTNFNQLNSLTSLNLSFSAITHFSLDLKTIKKLDLQYCPNLNDDSLIEIGKLPSLQELALAESKGFTDEGFQNISNLVNLEILSLTSFKSLSDKGLIALLKSKKITSLNLNFCRNLTAHSLEHIASKCVLLEQLRLNSCSRMFSGKEVKFNEIIGLKVLALNECTSITGTKFNNIIKPLINLEVLEIENLSKVADEAVPILESLKCLRKIELSGTKITENFLPPYSK